MRVLLWTDMEGMSRVTDHRECWPAFDEYWAVGRQKFTDEVKAAASGLLAGGASAVYVVNAHGLGWPNILWSELPDGAAQAGDAEWARGFDAAFMVGFHARKGTADGFISHTMVPGLAVSINGRPVTEPHIWAWLEEIPVLGIVGDRSLEDQLDGFLADTPFLAVKESTSRTSATPIHQDRAASHAAVSSFAAGCAGNPLQPLELPAEFVLEVELDAMLAPLADGQAGLQLTGEGVLRASGTSFSRDAYPAIQAAMSASLQPFFAAQGEVDSSTADGLEHADPSALAGLRNFFTTWVEGP